MSFLFDVYISGNYQSRETVEDVAKSFGIDVVPIILEGTIDAGVVFVKEHPKSTMGTAYMEGLVGRPKVEMRDRCGKRQPENTEPQCCSVAGHSDTR